MDPPHLTDRERQTLKVIEERLRRDRRLERRLSTMRRGVRSWTGVEARWPRVLLVLGAAGSLVLLVTAVATGSPVWITAFAVVWPATLALAGWRLVHWCRRAGPG
ncbi:DUF3040 domain-containing protein [Streptomyces sp. NPDC046557]|uniref:DUF3040 domain-containing protein n=1 Tax=Streptomyces sp. NPDC046557 TaxID=3155372 RepID=UPI0033E706D0